MAQGQRTDTMPEISQMTPQELLSLRELVALVLYNILRASPGGGHMRFHYRFQVSIGDVRRLDLERFVRPADGGTGFNPLPWDLRLNGQLTEPKVFRYSTPFVGLSADDMARYLRAEILTALLSTFPSMQCTAEPHDEKRGVHYLTVVLHR